MAHVIVLLLNMTLRKKDRILIKNLHLVKGYASAR